MVTIQIGSIIKEASIVMVVVRDFECKIQKSALKKIGPIRMHLILNIVDIQILEKILKVRGRWVEVQK